MNEYIGEFLGTMIMILFGSGIGCSLNLKKTLASGGGWVMVAIGWGYAVMLGVYVSGFWGSPGHLNPAVTISFALGGLTNWSVVPGYIIAQFLGAFLGAIIVMIQYYPHFQVTKPEEGNTVGIFATGPAIPNTIFNLLSEVITTCIFVFTLLFLGDFSEGLKPVVVGFLVAAIGFSFGSTTGYAINPARDFGPRLAYALFPLPNKGDANFGYAWIPIVGPIIGACVGVLLFNGIAG